HTAHVTPSFLETSAHYLHLPAFPTRRSSDLFIEQRSVINIDMPSNRPVAGQSGVLLYTGSAHGGSSWLRYACRYNSSVSEARSRSEEHTSELQSRSDLVCRLLLEKKKPLPLHFSLASRSQGIPTLNFFGYHVMPQFLCTVQIQLRQRYCIIF